MRNQFLFTTLFLSFSILSSAQQLVDKVICQVGGEIILLSDVEKGVSYIKATYGDVGDDPGCYVLQDLIAQKLLINQAKLDSIVVTDEEVNDQIDARLEQILSSMGNDESRFEEFYGRSLEEVRLEQQENLRNTLYTQKMRGDVMAGVVATPEEVEEFFNDFPQDSLPYFHSEVEISEISYKIPASQAKKDEARTTLEGVRKRVLEDPTQFSSMVTLYSDDPSAKDNKGDLGWAKRGTFVPEYEAAAYNLENGEWSEVVETEFGFHLIQLLDRRGNLIHTRHILIRPDVTPGDFDIANNLMDSVKLLLENDSMAFEVAVRRYSDKKDLSYNNGGRLTNPTTGTTFYEIGQLESDVFFAIDNLEVGQYSEPVLVDNLGEEPYYKLYRLDSRSEPHQASLATDYAKIQSYASENKKQRMFNEWLLNRASETYVEIDPRYACPDIRLWLEK